MKRQRHQLNKPIYLGKEGHTINYIV
jgi:hypothetical protein